MQTEANHLVKQIQEFLQLINQNKDLVRLLTKVIYTHGGCWEWTDATNPEGYGVFKYQGKTRKAHRVSYTLLIGPIPSGMSLDHICRNRKCINPDHLEPVTPQENTTRGDAGIKSGLLQRAKTQCPKGHPYDEENTRIDKLGKRICRLCNRDRMRLVYERQRSEKVR